MQNRWVRNPSDNTVEFIRYYAFVDSYPTRLNGEKQKKIEGDIGRSYGSKA